MLHNEKPTNTNIIQKNATLCDVIQWKQKKQEVV